jgi:hypothetical protein
MTFYSSRQNEKEDVASSGIMLENATREVSSNDNRRTSDKEAAMEKKYVWT